MPDPTRPDESHESHESHELRDAALTYLPAILVAFVLNWTLVEQRGWQSRRALIASVLVGIVVAILLQRALARRGRGG